HAGDVDRLSIKALFPRFVDSERKYGSLLRAFSSNPESRIPNPDGVFRSLPGGLSELTAALSNVLPAGSIKTNTSVSGLRAQGSRLHIETTSGDSLCARAVVLATPDYVTWVLTRG